jgi:hypothetical protein
VYEICKRRDVFGILKVRPDLKNEKCGKSPDGIVNAKNYLVGRVTEIKSIMGEIIWLGSKILRLWKCVWVLFLTCPGAPNGSTQIFSVW